MNKYKNSKKKCSVQQENCKTNNVQEGNYLVLFLIIIKYY